MLGPVLLCLLLLPLAGTQEVTQEVQEGGPCSHLAASLQCSSPDTWATLQCRHAAAPGPCTLVANHHR